MVTNPSGRDGFNPKERYVTLRGLQSNVLEYRTCIHMGCGPLVMTNLTDVSSPSSAVHAAPPEAWSLVMTNLTDTCLKALLSILDWNNNPKIQNMASHPNRCKKKARTGDGDRTACTLVVWDTVGTSGKYAPR